jgi:hypothetical protein
LFVEQENKKEQLQGTCASYLSRRDENLTMTILDIVFYLKTRRFEDGILSPSSGGITDRTNLSPDISNITNRVHNANATQTTHVLTFQHLE